MSGGLVISVILWRTSIVLHTSIDIRFFPTKVSKDEIERQAV